VSTLRRTLSEYVEHFHAERNHQGKGNVLRFPRDTLICRWEPVQCRERLGGRLLYYHREATRTGGASRITFFTIRDRIRILAWRDTSAVALTFQAKDLRRRR